MGNHFTNINKANNHISLTEHKQKIQVLFICIPFEIQLSRTIDWVLINQLNPAIFLCMAQVKTCFPSAYAVVVFVFNNEHWEDYEHRCRCRNRQHQWWSCVFRNAWSLCLSHWWDMYNTRLRVPSSDYPLLSWYMS